MYAKCHPLTYQLKRTTDASLTLPVATTPIINNP